MLAVAASFQPHPNFTQQTETAAVCTTSMHGRKQRIKPAFLSAEDAERLQREQEEKEKKLIDGYKVIGKLLSQNQEIAHLSIATTTTTANTTNTTAIPSADGIPFVSVSNFHETHSRGDDVAEEEEGLADGNRLAAAAAAATKKKTVRVNWTELEAALCLNPESHSLWILRRRLLIHLLRSPQGSSEGLVAAPDSFLEAVDAQGIAGPPPPPPTSSVAFLTTHLQDELDRTTARLQTSPKVYCVWFHRLWVLKQLLLGVLLFWPASTESRFSAGNDGRVFATNGLSVRDDDATATESSLSVGERYLRRELSVCDTLLAADDRNFHCWNHRQFVCSVLRCLIALVAELREAPEAYPVYVEAAKDGGCLLRLRRSSSSSSPLMPEECPVAADLEPQEAATSSYHSLQLSCSGSPPGKELQELRQSHDSVCKLTQLLYNDRFPHTNLFLLPPLPHSGRLPPALLVALYKRCFGSIAPNSLVLSGEKLELLDANETKLRIEASFSNYSAWHLRSLLPYKHTPLEPELDWVRQGLYTEPADQSLWQYYWWLLFERREGGGEARLLSTDEFSSLMQKELLETDTLLQLEPDSKYALITKCRLLDRLREHVGGWAEQATALYGRLLTLDTARRNVYRRNIAELQQAARSSN